jgi:DNA-binding NarL/FixJ family response regulator
MDSRSSPDARLRRVRTLGGILPALGVTVTPSGDGQVSVRLPAEVAELFLLDLEQRTQEWAEGMRQMRLEETRRQAEIKVFLNATSRKLQAEEEAWLAEYERLRGQGTTHREAIHRIAGYDPATPRRLQDYIPLTVVEEGIHHARARARTRRLAERNEEIVKLAQGGLSRRKIAARLGLTYTTVWRVLKATKTPVPGVRCRNGSAERLDQQHHLLHHLLREDSLTGAIRQA